MSRRTDRKHAFVLIYQLPFHKELDGSEAVEHYLSQLEEDMDFDRPFIESEFNGTSSKLEQIDPLIAKYTEGWTIGRINKVDLAIMRLAVYEIMFVEDIPVRVSINEAVELAKVYGIDDSASFINGILGKIASAVNPAPVKKDGNRS